MRRQEDEAAEDVLRVWLRDCKNSMLQTFLDFFDIKHEGGITEEDNWQEKIKKGDINGAIAKLKEGFQPVDIWIYLSFLDIEEVDAAPGMKALI